MNHKQLPLPGFVDFAKKKNAKRKPPYIWTPGGTLPTLGRHSLAKHEVLSSYLKKYVSILAGRIEQDQLMLTLVDGFSGGGTYLHPETGDTIPGSPLLMISAMRDAEASENARRDKRFQIKAEYYFVERNKSTISCLETAVSEAEMPDSHRNNVHLLRGKFTDQLDSIIDQIEKRNRSRRVIFLLDQYGYSNVPMSDIRRIFSKLPNAEVILTIAINWLVDFISDHDNTKKILSNMSLDANLLAKIKEENPDTWRPKLQNYLGKHFHQSSGAACYTPFFIHSVESHRAYWLLHFSGHSKARDVMCELHWELENHFQHFGGSGFGMLGFDPRQIVQKQYRSFPFEFDETAEAQTRQELLANIPKRISAMANEIPFGCFFNAHVNDTPATKRMFEDSIRTLTKDGELKIKTSSGKVRRNGVKINEDDLIILPRQQIFLPPRNKT